MIAGRSKSFGFGGWGRGGRGSAPSSAHRGRRERELANAQTLSAIVDRDLSSLVLPHQHAAAARRPLLTLPFQLQQPVFIAHHPVFTDHSFLFQPEHFASLPRRGLSAVIIGLGRSPPPVRRLYSATNY